LNDFESEKSKAPVSKTLSKKLLQIISRKVM
jgi:hypothetical protein